MTPEDIQKIREIIDTANANGQSLTMQSYAVAFLVGVIASAIGAYVGAYLKRRGENLATKEDFAELLRQARRTTEATERIKSDIASEVSLKSKRFEAALKIFEFLIKISTDINRHRNGHEVPGLFNNDELVPLTVAFNQIQSQRAILGPILHSDLSALANCILQLTNSSAATTPSYETIGQEFLALQDQFNSHLVSELSASATAIESDSQ